MKLVAVCGFGVGSSIIAKMNIESILQKRNREDIVVETIDLGSVQGADGDYYVTPMSFLITSLMELKSALLC